MAEATTALRPVASTLSSSGKLSPVTKVAVVVKTPAIEDNEEDNNQQDEEKEPEGHDQDVSGDELQTLRSENSKLEQRLKRMEMEHSQQIQKLEAKLQKAIETHKEIEQRLKTQLHTVLQEQQAAAENARKVRSVLTRVTGWMRQVQRAAQRERSSHVNDLELTVTPRPDSPCTLWVGTTDTPECDEPSNKLTLNQNPLQWPVPDSCGVEIEGTSQNGANSPPPAPSRHRTKNLPVKGFNYVGYCASSPSSRSSEDVHKPSGGHEIVLNGLPSVCNAPHKDTPVPKQHVGRLLSYCAQVVTTSLAGVRSSSSPGKTVSAWKLDRLAPLLEVDEEAGECAPRTQSRLNVAVPNLSIGLL
ncbi:hypothetical protein P3T76_002713 [Phytophthora citrophthora]|uniref:Uncharacterized protein n=1 Tax=Phytophthora citrophthora TaxID=4793 RepID=A0AAD9LQA1_9STRA|nr:hypothetical protein P3T76_002713 [Phytophthora citrophthora]